MYNTITKKGDKKLKSVRRMHMSRIQGLGSVGGSYDELEHDNKQGNHQVL